MKKLEVLFSPFLSQRQSFQNADSIWSKNRQTVFYIPVFICLVAAQMFAQEANKQNANAKDKAGSSLQVGKALPGTSRIVPGTAQYLLYALLPNGNKQIISLLTRTVEFSHQNGEPIISVTQRYDNKEGFHTDTSTVNRRTLEPLAYQSELSGQKEPVFNAVVEQEIIQSLPFKSGYVISAKIYNPGKAFLSSIYRVVRSERLETAGGTEIEAWVIETGRATYWISKRTQDLIMMKVSLSNGSQFWKVRLYANT